MGYKSLIDKNLSLAFNLTKDLATDITLLKKTSTDYNFATGAVDVLTTETVTVKGIVIQTEKNSKERNTSKQQVMLKRADVGDITKYDTLQYDSKVWNIGEIPKNDGYIVLVDIYREG
jgi:hypothetical protein